MSILINKDTRVVCQGFTGKQASKHSQAMLSYGTKLVAGVSPAKGGTKHLGLPVFDTVEQAIKYDKKIDTSIIFVPAKYVYDAVAEAVSAGIKTIVCITEGVPVMDMLHISKLCEHYKVIFIGPNTPGVITPDECKLGIMPTNIFSRGKAGVISRSGTLTYEAVYMLSKLGIGQSTCIGIGGDPVIGFDFERCLELFRDDEETEIIVMLGEIGGNLEERAALYIKENWKKPVIAYIAGITMPPETKMGHAGAIIRDLNESADKKIEFLQNNGIIVARHLAELEDRLKEFS